MEKAKEAEVGEAKEASGDEPPPPPTPEDPDDVEWFPQAPPPQPPSAEEAAAEAKKEETPEGAEQEGSGSGAGEVLGMDIAAVLPVQEGDKTAFSEEDEIQYWIEDMGAVTASLQTGFHVVVTVIISSNFEYFFLCVRVSMYLHYYLIFNFFFSTIF